MARRVLFTPLLIALLLVLGTAVRVEAATPSDKLAPATTKGYLSIPDIDQLRSKFNETQLGQLMKDPVMQPFAEDLKRQLKNKFSQTGVRLGVTLEDLEGVAGGEVAVALVQPGGDKAQHALVLIVDITGKHDEAKTLLDKISRNQIEKGSKRANSTHAGVEITGFTLAKKKGQTEASQMFHFVHGDNLIAADHAATIQELAGRAVDGKGETLSGLKAYQVCMQRAQDSGGSLAPHVRWFVEPFGYMEASRAMSGGRKKRGTDMLKVLANQGFNAIQGVGGYVTFATGEHEILHRSFVYAPADPKAHAGDRYRLAARMLDFPNSNDHTPQPWVPAHLANYVSFQMKIKESFEYIGSLVDEVAGEPGVFEEVLKSIAKDRNGPQVDLRKELIAFAGERVTVMTDCRQPVTTKSERLAVGIEVTKPEEVAKAIHKIMSSDPNAHKHEIDGHIVWEIVNEEAPVEVETLQIEGAEFVAANEDDETDEDDEDKPLIPNSAVTVAHGQLLIASHLDYIRELLAARDANNTVGVADDYQRVTGALAKLGSKSDSLRGFTRTDEAYQATYELLRQGKMPESETMFGKVLNRLLGPDEEGVLREQEIDGSKMPEFEFVRKYLGPAGAYVQSEKDGWIVIGCLIEKPAAK